MFVVMGANGQTGGAVARRLLDQGHEVRVVLRPGRNSREWQSRGASAAHADVHDAEALTSAFTGARGAYVLNPPDASTSDMTASARDVAEACATALRATGTRPVVLSSIGAQHAEGTGAIRTAYVLEEVLSPLGASFVRAGAFMTNWLPALPAMREGTLPSFYVPVDRPVPHVSVEDIADTAVRELHRDDSRIIELAAAADYTPRDVASAFAAALGRTVTARAVERDQWSQVLADTGMAPALIPAYEEMWDGFNSGCISFEGEPERGAATIEEFAKAAAGMSGP